MNKGLYKHQYCLSLHSNQDPIKIKFHFEDSYPLSQYIKPTTQKIEWLQSKLPPIQRKAEINTDRTEVKLKTHYKGSKSIRITPTSQFTIIMKTNTPVPAFQDKNTKFYRYEQCEEKQYLVNKYIPPRKLGLHRGMNSINYPLDKD